MSLEVAARAMDFPGVELEDLALAGDDTAWSLDDWAWDGKSFTATPVPGSGGRSGKRPCFGLHAVPGSLSGLLGDEPAASCCTAASGATSMLEPEEAASPPSIGRAKEAEAGQHGEVGKLCQVEGCGRELAGLSTYHQRCRICEVHLKEPHFMRAGLLQRFCQQCGRCHPLDAFQGAKRSCREQLAKHNARRRRRSEKKAGSPPQQQEQPQQQPAAASVPAAAACQCQPGLADALTGFSPFMPPLEQQGQVSSAAVGPQAPASLAYAVFPAAGYLPASFHMAAFAQQQQQMQMQAFAPALQHPPPLPLPQQQQQQQSQEQEAQQQQQQQQQQQPAPALTAAMVPLPAVALGIPVMLPPPQPSAGPEQAPQPSSYDLALSMLGAPAAPQPAYRSDNLVLRLSLKLFNCTPAQLPPDLKQQLTGWLKSTPAGAEGYIRPGCVHLVLQAHLPAAAAEQVSVDGIRALAAHLQAQQQPVWRDHVVLADLNGRLGLLRGGALLHAWDGGGDAGELGFSGKMAGSAPAAALPRLALVSPAAVWLGDGGASVRVTGRGIACGDCRVMCRAGGRYFDAECQPFGACCQQGEGHAAEDPEQSITVRLPPSLPPGLAWLEVQRGCLLSQPRALLVCPSAQLAAELNSLAPCEDLLADFGLVMAASPSDEPAAWQLAVATAAKLAEHACQADLPHLLAVLAATPAFAALPPPVSGQPSLAHACVARRSLAALATLLSLPGAQAQASHTGPGGLTPLHLAALQPGGEAAALLLPACPPDAWSASLAWDGLSPADFAARAQAAAAPAAAEAAAAAEAPDCSREAPFVLEMGPEAAGEAAAEYAPLLLQRGGGGAAAAACVAWPGPLGPALPAGLAGRWSSTALLGVAACMCTCVVLLRDWV